MKRILFSAGVKLTTDNVGTAYNHYTTLQLSMNTAPATNGIKRIMYNTERKFSLLDLKFENQSI